MRLSTSYLSDIGLERGNQEDNGLILLKEDSIIKNVTEGTYDTHVLLAVIADGMGGTNFGEIASRLTIESFLFDFNKKELNKDNAYGFLKDAIDSADQRIKEANNISESGNMGTTIVSALLIGSGVYLSWVGDSRCYKFTLDNKLVKLTADHSLVNKLVSEHKITEVEAEHHPLKHIITKSLGAEDASPDLIIEKLQEGEMLLLCSDGLNTMVEDEVIQVILSEPTSITEKNRALVQEALKNGGKDNITTILIKKEALESEIVAPITQVEKPKETKSKSTKPQAKSYNLRNILIGLATLVLIASGIKFLFSKNEEVPKFEEDHLQNVIPTSDTIPTAKPKIENLISNTIDTQKVESKEIQGENYSVRIDTYLNEKEAKDVGDSFRKKYTNYEVIVEKMSGNYYEVIVSGFAKKEDAQSFITAASLQHALILYKGEK